MMGKKGAQLCLAVIDLEELIPVNHLLRIIDRAIEFDFIYGLAEPYYSERAAVNRPSLHDKNAVGKYLYGIRSERKLEEEIQRLRVRTTRSSNTAMTLWGALRRLNTLNKVASRMKFRTGLTYRIHTTKPGR